MRITIPTVPEALLSRKGTPIDVSQASEKVANFLSGGNALVITGAGVSVESGIRLGTPNNRTSTMNSLILPREVTVSGKQRYWSRSYLGYPPVRDAQPNPTHFALAALQWSGFVPRLITQNVDGLHQKAVPNEAPLNSPGHILELHGTLHVGKNHTVNREEFQDQLSRLNPAWKDFVDEMTRTGTQPRTNPDGDVDIRGVDFSNFVLPVCKTCLAEGIRDDAVDEAGSDLFWRIDPSAGETKIVRASLSTHAVKNQSPINFATNHRFSDVEASDRVLFIGTTLATYSAFRLLKHAIELNKPTMLLNLGPTRAHGVPEVDIVEAASSDVLRAATRTLAKDLKGEPGRVVNRLLESGVVTPPPDDMEDRAPRAAG
ncbi:DHS-like NAD FAD-binding protein, partial [Rhizoctonia solani]